MPDLYLNIGCGRHSLPGFLNIDVDEDADVRYDVTQGLPYGDGSVDGIFSEHFLEHLTQGQGAELLRECRRVLKPGGILRIAMPDLDAPVKRYLSEDWRGDADMFRLGYDWVDNRCEMLNLCMREWGHQWLYNEEELTRIARFAGLHVLGRRRPGEGADPHLAGREYRRSSRLIMEFRPTDRPLAEGVEPLVSVLIAAYKPVFFREALDSALAQSYPNIEVVICDDSRDGAIEEMVNAAPDPRVRYIRNERRLGGRANYAKCLSLAEGEFVKYLNDDDRLHPGCIARLVDCFRGAPRLRLATSRRRLIDAGGRAIPDQPFNRPLVQEDSLIEGRSLARLILGSGLNVIGEPSTAMFRREDGAQIRPDPFSFGGEGAPGLGDVALWLNLLSRGDCAYLAETLSDFRLHSGQRQREPEVASVTDRSWERLRHHGLRLGLWYPGAEKTADIRPLSLPSGGLAGDAAAGRDYAAWCEQHRLTEADAQLMAERMMRDWKHCPSVHLIAVVQQGQEGGLVETVTDINHQLYRGWGLTIFAAVPCPDPALLELENIEWIQASGDVSSMVNRTMGETGADWVALVEAGDRLEAHLLFCCVDHINRHPEWRLVYVDEDTIDDQGRRSDPRFKPDFNLDLLRSSPYVGSFCLVDRASLERAGGWIEREGLESYDAAFRVLETCGEGAIGHVAEMLYHRRDGNAAALLAPPAQEAGRAAVADHLARLGIRAEVSAAPLPGGYFVNYLHERQPQVSVIIPTRDRAQLLRGCVESLLAKTDYPNYEIVVVDNGSTAADSAAYLQELEGGQAKVRVVRYPGAYNGAAMLNHAAEACRGEYLLFLDDDTVIVQGQWLERMLACGRRPEVGIVGARLVLPDLGIEHAGVVLGMGSNGVAARPFSGLPMPTPGPMGRAQLTQNYSAVSGACLLIDREVFHRVGGLDAGRLAVAYHDVDLCLKVRQAGYKIVWTPFATVARCGAQRLGPPAGEQSGEAARGELATVLQRWLPQLARDPAYNRHLTLADRACVPEVELDVPWDPDIPGPTRILGGGLGYGSLHYRVREPLAALKHHARAQVGFIPSHHDRLRVPSVAELERAAPDVLLWHNSIHEIHLEVLQWYRRFNHVFTVFGQDDLIFDIPEDHPLRERGVKDAVERVRSALAQCDRLVVTTEALAHAHRHMIDDIRVVPNYLERERWDRLQSLRRASAKPRVGWAGAQQHHGDLKLLIAVVEATAAEVDWIFFGMCPDEILPVVKEFHTGVPYEQYPDKLAALNLDIAVAPLALNRFNECKSNLRLLEYGVLGWPVICSDILPYRGAPVQRVANRPGPWIDAVMDRARDLDAAAREGDRLRAWVKDGWMLDDHLDEWLQALSPAAAAARRRASG